MKRMRTPIKMNEDNVLHTAEFIKNRLYLVTLNCNITLKSTPTTHYFAVDTEQCYDNFYSDFGPLNLARLYNFCAKLDVKLSNAAYCNRKIIFHTGLSEKNRVNAAFIVASYSIIKLNFNAEEAYEILTKDIHRDFIEFRDASIGDPYTLPLYDCLKAVKKALDLGFFDFDNFDCTEYEHYERVENGDLNWILPGKFIAFCGPHSRTGIERGYPIHAPETYFSYFRRHNVTTVVRLNKKAYDANRFIDAGFGFLELFFVDGGIPTGRILSRFIAVCEGTEGAVAVHCKAGLGRTGTLIACYIMKHYRFTALEAIAWIRICRPGSIIAHQQTWLIQNQKQLWAEGEQYRLENKIDGPIKHSVGIYPLPAVNNNKPRSNINVTGIMRKVDSMEISDKNEEFASEENKITQGDRLNQIKAARIKTKAALSNLNERRSFRSKILSNAAGASPLRNGRLAANSTKSTATTRVLTKRNELNEAQTARRCSQRKINATLLVVKDKTKMQESAKLLPKKKENLSWLHKNGDSLAKKCVTERKVDSTLVKRCKRTLATLEKDKASHSVKVLRRSHGQTSTVGANDGELRLPSVALNKSI